MARLTNEARRRAIIAEAETLAVPAFLTPTWQATYGRPPLIITKPVRA